MKKILCYMPVFLMLFVMMISSIVGSLNTYFYIFTITFLISGVLLSRDKVIGGIIGIVGGVFWFYMGLSNWKLQSIDFTVAGTIIVFYLGFTIYLVRKKR